MSSNHFPELRDDGTLSVAARYTVPNEESVRRLEAVVSEWNQGAAGRGIDLLAELSTLPHVARRERLVVDVVFQGKRGSRRWKDWMVAVTKVVRSTLPEVSFESFYDLVAERPHPASLREHRLSRL